MTATPYPVPRSTRQSLVLTGDGRTTYGPFGDGWGIFDVADVRVETRPVAGSGWTVAAATVAKVNPAERYSPFTITFPVALTAATQFQVTGLRIANRSVAVTRGGTVSSLALEEQLSQMAVVDQELRRDIDAIRLPDIQGWGAAGPLAGRAAHDDEAPGFTYLVTDQGALVYYVRSGAAGTWLGPYAANATAVMAEHVAAADPHPQYQRKNGTAVSFTTVAALLASLTLTYSAGTPGSVEPGNIVTTTRDRFSYAVAASGATDHHRVTAGGVKLYALPDKKGRVALAQLGAVENTDCTALLQQLLQAGFPRILVSGRYGVTSLSATLTAPLRIESSGTLYRVGTGNTAAVSIECAGNNIEFDGDLLIDGQDNCSTALQISNTHATMISPALTGVRVRNVYRRFNVAKGNAWGIAVLGNVGVTRLARCEAVSIRREADSALAGASGTAGIVITGTGGFWPKKAIVDDIWIDTVSCDDPNGDAKNTDCDGLVIFTNAAAVSGFLTGDSHGAVIANLRGRNCKGRLLKAQCGHVMLNGFAYEHENMGCIEGGISIINPQSGVTLIVSGPCDVKLRNNGASPFRGGYMGFVVDLYSVTDHDRPQMHAHIGPITITSDYVNSGFQAIVGASGGIAEQSILNVDGVSGLVEAKYYMALPASATQTQAISVKNCIISKLTVAMFSANAEAESCIVSLENSGHLGAQVPGVRDPGNDTTARRCPITLSGRAFGIQGPALDTLTLGTGGLPLVRRGFEVPLNAGPSSMGSNCASLTLTNGAEVTFPPMTRRSGGRFLLVIPTSIGSAGYNIDFSVDGTTITPHQGSNTAWFAFGAGADPGTASRFNVWIDPPTGAVKVFNRMGSTRESYLEARG